MVAGAEGDDPARPLRLHRLRDGRRADPLVVARQAGSVAACSSAPIPPRAEGRPAPARRATATSSCPTSCTGWPTSIARSTSAWAFRIPLTAIAGARAASTACSWSACACSADEQPRKAELETLLRHHALQPHRPRARPAGHADEQHRGRGLRRTGAARRSRRRASTTCKAPLFTLESGLARQAATGSGWPSSSASIRRCSRTRTTPGATDQRAARAMNTALVAGDARLLDGDDDGAGLHAGRHRADARLLHPVRRRPAAPFPAIRIGAQPYGILPATTFSRMPWLDQRRRDDPRSRRGSADPRWLPAPALPAPARRSTTTVAAVSARSPFVGKAGRPAPACCSTSSACTPARSSGRSGTRRA